MTKLKSQQPLPPSTSGLRNWPKLTRKSWSKANLKPEHIEAASREWFVRGRLEQLPPRGDWNGWLLIGGRGSGKTRAGSEWINALVRGLPVFSTTRIGQIALIGETLADVRDVMIEGPSGILAAAHAGARPKFEISRRRVVWPNGAIAMMFSAEDPDSLRGPQFEAAWCDEIGCPAIDKGANQPNVFGDPKSAESAIPHFSSGARDDLQQRLYLETHLTVFDPASDGFDAGFNPVSTIYGGNMLDVSRFYAWAYDTRPFPAFPRDGNLWDDGENWRTGHWLNGRLGGVSLADLIGAIVKDHGLGPIDTGRLAGWMHGYAVLSPQSVRESIEPLFDLFGAGWRPKTLVPESFSLDSRPYTVRTITDVVATEKSAEITRTRSANSALPTELVFSFSDPVPDYQNATVSARLPGNTSINQAQINMPIVMDGDTASGLANTWLRRANEEAETLRCELAPDHADIEVGDCVILTVAGTEPYRIERIIYGQTQAVEARKAKAYPMIMTGKNQITSKSQPQDVAASGRANVLLMDLPGTVQRNGLQSPVVRIAAYAKPWKRQLILAAQDQGDIPIGDIVEPATMGELVAGEGDVCRGRRSGKPLIVRLYGGALQSVSLNALLSGANTAAMRATSGVWEVFQFQTVEEIAAQTWRLTGLLRGQRGTKDAMLAGFEAGAPFVVLDGAVAELTFSDSFSAERSLRIGPAARSVTDSSWQTIVSMPLTRSIMPLAPEQLGVKSTPAGLLFQWVRCGRINADDWDGFEIPFDETAEAYTIEIINSLGVAVRTATVTAPEYTYLPDQRLSDLGSVSGSFTFKVRQSGLLPGLGLEAELQIV